MFIYVIINRYTDIPWYNEASVYINDSVCRLYRYTESSVYRGIGNLIPLPYRIFQYGMIPYRKLLYTKKSVFFRYGKSGIPVFQYNSLPLHLIMTYESESI